MMRVGIISTVGVPACYGGYETLVENLLTHKQNSNFQYQVYCSSLAYPKKQKVYKKAILKYLPFKANGPMGIIYDSLSLFHAYYSCDVIMSLGTVGCFWLPLLKIFSSKKVIINMDGMDEKREKWNTVAGFIIGCARSLAAKKADLIISDNQVIQKYIKDRYQRDSCLIEYGGDNAYPYYDEIILLKYGLSKGDYAFKVARIEPENKIDIILDSFSKIPAFKLVLVGNWNNSEYGKQIRLFYEKFDNLILLNPIYDAKYINLLRSNCKFYIHGHSAGGTNPSLVEAMYLSLPIIATDVSYNRSTTEEKALYFKNADDLCLIIKSLTDEKLRQMAIDMREIAQRRYLWSIIADKYENLYN